MKVQDYDNYYMANYDSSFFAYVNSGSLVSAEKLLPFLLNTLRIDSVLDVGCGQGAWLSVWRQLGVEDVVGIDGDYVGRNKLMIPESSFQPIDLTTKFHIGRKFDLVQSLEVAEHLPISVASQFVDGLCAHSDLVFFSAAPPGQGGDNHVNEQPYEYWRELFLQRGYFTFDFIRPLVVNDRAIEPWYRFNTFLYASEGRANELPETVRATLVPSNTKLKDISPVSYRIRKAFVSVLPVSVMTKLAKIKEKRVTRIRMKRSIGS